MDQQRAPTEAQALVRDAREHVRTSRSLLDQLHREVTETERTMRESRAAVEDSLRLLNHEARNDAMMPRR